MNRTDLAQPDACLHGASSLRNADGAPACLLCRREEARALTVEDLAHLPGACPHGASGRRTASGEPLCPLCRRAQEEGPARMKPQVTGSFFQNRAPGRPYPLFRSFSAFESRSNALREVTP